MRRRLPVRTALVLAAMAMFPFASMSASGQQASQPSPVVQPTKHKKAAAPASGSQNLGLGSHDSNAPIDITADNFAYDLNAKIGTYTGNVVVIQGDMHLRSDKMNVNVTQGKPTHIEAIGHVVVTSPNSTATGDKGVYDLGPRTITMTGNVVLTKEKDVMRGTKLVMDMNTNVAHLYAQGMPGGRVRALFVPPPKQNTDAGTGTSPAKKAGKSPSKHTATAAPAIDPPPE